MFGFLNINKPSGMTSHDVVALLRRILKFKQIGHTGTLDPMATGVLPVALGKAARLIEFLDEKKAYTARCQLGKISDSYDTDGNVEHFSDKKVTKEDVEKALKCFEGEIEQIPPAFSAVHYNGKRLYELARQGIIPDDIPKRKVFVSKICLCDFDEKLQIAEIQIECSKGTYIRSIIHDMGQLLSTGAVMSALTRTQSGRFSIDNAITISKDTTSEFIQSSLINPVDVLSYCCHELTDAQYDKVKHGNALESDKYEDKEYVCLMYNEQMVALSQKDSESQKLITKKVFI